MFLDRLESYIEWLEDGHTIDTEECMRYLQDAYDEIAAWQDTGLTPAQCAELAKAEDEGRLVELPCKVGNVVWVLYHYYETDCIKSSKTMVLPAEVTKIETRNFWAGGKDLSHIKVCYEILDTEFLVKIGRRHESSGWHYWDDNFIYLAREAAEAALEDKP